MTSYDVPNADENMDPEVAQRKVNALMADCITDESHPYQNSAHPQAKEYATYAHSLFVAIARGKQAASDAADQKIIDDRAAGRDGLSLRMKGEAMTSVKALNALGVKGVCPDRPTAGQVRGLTMQLQLVQRDYSGLTNSLERELRMLQPPREITSKLSDAKSFGLSPDARETLLGDILLWTQDNQRKG